MSEVLTKDQALGLLLEEIVENIRCINSEIASIKGDYHTRSLWAEKNTKLLELSIPIISSIKYNIKTDFIYDNGKLEMRG